MHFLQISNSPELHVVFLEESPQGDKHTSPIMNERIFVEDEKHHHTLKYFLLLSCKVIYNC